jgi:nitronate monooxygenase
MEAAFLARLGVRVPIIQAPMAGGPDTPALAAAVIDAGGLGSLGCAYLSDAQIDAVVSDLRQRTRGSFALNLFVRADEPSDESAAARVAPILDRFRRELGLGAPKPAKAAPSYPAQLAAVIRAKPRVWSFTFGAPTAEEVATVRATGILVVGTATTLDEAEALESLGVDAICAQGSEAGGHRGTFLGRYEDALVGTMALTRAIVGRVRLPVIAAGGVMDGAGIRAALSLGATAVQLGTAFLLCPEAGTHVSHRAALTSPMARRTVVTRGFSGRAARGLRNALSDAFETIAAAPFPQQQALTAELRAAAAAQGATHLMQLWAGQGAPMLRELPAAELVRVLCTESGLG